MRLNNIFRNYLMTFGNEDITEIWVPHVVYWGNCDTKYLPVEIKANECTIIVFADSSLILLPDDGKVYTGTADSLEDRYLLMKLCPNLKVMVEEHTCEQFQNI